ncbi:hypothetical protein UFOVP760_29 [uncultured Caudovirales phage]|uniref:Uncharacterized protein n=1 Tax=uncultured Caudovirales phage TaxID=2100421 RepID=A0A6J7X5Y4_9CAUD|nr:hypothetical protein UFOVP760_29 [uncultured Caudovirales phage]
MNKQSFSTRQFLKEIEEVCVKWKKSIGHEDGHGSFIVHNYDEANIEWLKDATDESFPDLKLDLS